MVLIYEQNIDILCLVKNEEVNRMIKKNRIVSFVLACVLCAGTYTGAAAATQDEIAYVQSQKQYAEAGFAQTQANISNLEARKQELEYYLYELDQQYHTLTAEIEQLHIDAQEKQAELEVIQQNLERTRKAADDQYESMKLRIVYMYENGGSGFLEQLLAAGSIADLLNKAENVSQISQYDRDMLKKYEELLEEIKQQEQLAEEEKAQIHALMEETQQKQEEVESLAAATNNSIASYINQIQASQEEAAAFLAEISSANNQIADLMERAEAEKAAAQAAAYAKAQEQAASSAGTGSQESTYSESYTESSSTDAVQTETSTEYAEESYVEESYVEESYEEVYESYQETSSSGQGTYLGNFKLTAYCNCASCCGTAGNATASGTMPSAGRTVAMGGIDFGTQLMINGSVYTVEDRGTPYGHVDIFFNSHSEALSFGLQYADVYQLN